MADLAEIAEIESLHSQEIEPQELFFKKIRMGENYQIQIDAVHESSSEFSRNLERSP
jgi:hypothetical protein